MAHATGPQPGTGTDRQTDPSEALRFPRAQPQTFGTHRGRLPSHRTASGDGGENPKTARTRGAEGALRGGPASTAGGIRAAGPRGAG